MRHQADSGRIAVRSLIAAAAAVGIVIAGTAGTRAFDPEALDCLARMIVDPIGEYCFTGTAQAGTKSLSDVGSGIAPTFSLR